jgi:hypothetical protein
LPDGSVSQSAYRVEVSSRDDFRDDSLLWDRGKVDSDQSQFRGESDMVVHRPRS